MGGRLTNSCLEMPSETIFAFRLEFKAFRVCGSLCDSLAFVRPHRFADGDKHHLAFRLTLALGSEHI